MFFIFGWGKKNKAWDLGDGKTFLCVWNYFSLFFSPVRTSAKWYILSENRAEDLEVDYKKIKLLCPDLPDISIWDKYGLFILSLIIIMFALISSL